MHRAIALAFALLLNSTAYTQSLPDPATATRRVESALEEAQQSVNNRVTFNGHANAVDRMLSDYQPKLSKTQVDEYRTQLAEYRAQFQRFADDEDVQRLGETVDAVEQQWSQLQTAFGADHDLDSHASEIDDLRRAIVDARKDLGKLPAARVSTHAARIEVVSSLFEARVGGAQAEAELARLREYWQRDTADFAGWEQETAIDFANYVSTRSASSNAFGLAKTLEIYLQAQHKLAQAKEGDAAPAAYLSEIEDVRARSRSKLLAAIDALVSAGQAKDASNENVRNAMQLLDDSLRARLDAETDTEFGALAGRTQAWLRTAAENDTQSEEGKARYYQRMTVSAAAAWPEMERQFEVVRGFDPNDPAALKGQLIRIETDNLMGWRFNTGDFPFATTISGMPVAATYDAEVEAAIAEIEGKLGRALGDSDDDGRWTIIAEVTGRMGRMQLRKQVEGDIRDASSGAKLGTYSGEKAESVDAPILRIVAAHIGPLAVARGVGYASADGSLATSDTDSGQKSTPKDTSTAGSVSGSWLGRAPAVLLGLLAAALCWIQAKPDSARNLAQAQGQAAILERVLPLLPWLGVGVAALGVVWLLRALVIYDLLPATALIAAALYSALPLLTAVLPAAQMARIRPLGLLLSIASAAAAGVHLLFGGLPVV